MASSILPHLAKLPGKPLAGYACLATHLRECGCVVMLSDIGGAYHETLDEMCRGEITTEDCEARLQLVVELEFREHGWIFGLPIKVWRGGNGDGRWFWVLFDERYQRPGWPAGKGVVT